ncbi:hypothetical protein EKE94_13880 [Mesobaculum littorinae]|uniref:Uncharacterized protein n=1 Tax=Mesobaculum littorinae TaxID=2486419 RepID=A0A438AG75_9RHOB|nr:hypothetical protein [Mesobaculum littorinae]RVV97615.1 hypothetical protein EKE94_13880 [Mesobaculum littorinae]
MYDRRKVIFHIGQTKAGSTSIQNYLDSQREALLEKGVLFPSSVFLRQNAYDNTRTPGHLKLVLDLRAKTMADLEQEIGEYPGHTVLLSVENIFSDQPDSTLRLIGEYFKDWDLTLLAVLRPQYDWLRSRYVENVMSGFSGRPMPFSKFVEDNFERGVLNYETRLQRLACLLRARESRAVVYGATEGGIVPAFLKAANLPMTAEEDASSIKSNQREKQAFLIEAKRRLNMIVSILPKEDRLEFEHLLRETAKARVSAGDAPGSVGTFPIPLSTAQRAEIWNGNRLLEKSGTLDAPLPLGDDCEAQAVSADVASATRDLFWTGMELASEIARRAEKPGNLSDSPLSLTPADLSALGDIMARCPVSVHMDAPQTALLAAAEPGRLVRLVLPVGAKSYEKTAKFDALPLPSPLIALSEKRAVRNSLQDLLCRNAIPRPDLLVVQSQICDDFLLDALRDIAPSVIVVIGATEWSRDIALPKDVEVRVTDTCTILERGGPSQA